MQSFDIIVLGAGPGGYNLAAEAAAKGLRTLIVEKGEPGGTCLNRGCIPTKCLLASAQALRSAANAADLGVIIEGTVKADYAAAHARMLTVVDRLRQGVETTIGGCTRLSGEAALTRTAEGDVAVEVNGEVFTAAKVVIATGSVPASLPIPGADLAINSDEVLSLEQLPQSAVIIGAGVIGMEFACILNAFGCSVTVIEYCPEILPPFDAEVAKRLRTLLSRRGISINVGCAVQAIEKGDNGTIAVRYQGKKGEAAASAQCAIMAVGRRPCIPKGAAEAGIALDRRGFIAVDPATMATSVPGVYAIGDVNGLCMLAHAAEAHAHVVMGHKVDLATIPSAVFTLPECAMVGPTEATLKAAGTDYAVGKAMYAGNGKAMAMGETDGFVKVLCNRADGRLLALHAIGAHAVDICAEAAACITLGATAADVSTLIVHGHPTLSEMLPAAIPHL